MNTIKFTSRECFTTEQHNLEVQNVVETKIFGKSVNLYTPCNLNIFITSICQNRCFFCINDGYTGTDIDDDAYSSSFGKLLEELDPLQIEITITGGEPTLKPERFVRTIRELNSKGFRCRTVSTTGLGLMNIVDGKPVCQHMIENNFVHNINISRMHYDEQLNGEIFKGKNITNADIQRLSEFYKINNAEMRTSCNIIPGYIDTMDKILQFVDFYRGLGLETVMFRELVGCDTLKLSDILRFDEQFKYLTKLEGMFYDVDVYSYKDMIVKHYLTKSNFDKNVIYSLSLRNGIFADNFVGKHIHKNLIEE